MTPKLDKTILQGLLKDTNDATELFIRIWNQKPYENIEQLTYEECWWLLRRISCKTREMIYNQWGTQRSMVCLFLFASLIHLFCLNYNQSFHLEMEHNTTTIYSTMNITYKPYTKKHDKKKNDFIAKLTKKTHLLQHSPNSGHVPAHDSAIAFAETQCL